MEEFLFTERYRPKTVEDCILPDRIKSVFQSCVEKKTIPNMMLVGPAGTGKTTIAKAMCNEVACDYLFINSSDERGIDTLRTKITNYASSISLTGGSKVIILDEADGITPQAQDALRGAIEAFSTNCTFILTANFKSKLINALHSRTSVVDFTLKSSEKPKMAQQLYKRLEFILTTEGITYDKTVLAKLVEKHFPDFRRVINELQRFASRGNIDAGVLADVDSLRSLNELVKSLKEKDFTKMRKWVVQNSDVDINSIYRSIYNGLVGFLKPESVPQAVVTIAKYQYQSAFVADQEICLVACLTELMCDCEVK
jgi:DNA polymerase III delta prime subunit